VSEHEQDPGRWYWRAFVGLTVVTTAVFLALLIRALA
jgi:hypothetical protein